MRQPSFFMGSQKLQQLIKRPPSKLLEMGKYLLPIPQSTRRFLLEEAKKKLLKFNKYKASRSPLDPDFRRTLQQEFASEVEQLSTLIGRDLTYWNQEDYWKS